jgi:ribosome-binding protein aMBF1 (putative translation factor)
LKKGEQRMIEGYKKLINDLKLHRKRLEAFWVEFNYNNNLFEDAKKPNTRRTVNDKPLNRIVEDIRYYENLINIETDSAERLEKKIKEIDECINESDITVKVGRLRALGMTQEDVAELIERSPRQVQRIEAKISNE